MTTAKNRDRPSGHGHDRPPAELRVCRAIRLLAAGKSEAETAREVRVMPPTLASWQQAEDFRALVKAAQQADRAQSVVEMLDALTPGAVEALRRALESDQLQVAVWAAREVLRYVSQIKQVTGQTITVEYKNPEHRAVSTPPWADRHPAPSGALQGGGVWSPLRQDGDGQDSADRAGADGPDLLVDQSELRDGR